MYSKQILQLSKPINCFAVGPPLFQLYRKVENHSTHLVLEELKSDRIVTGILSSTTNWRQDAKKSRTEDSSKWDRCHFSTSVRIYRSFVTRSNTASIYSSVTRSTLMFANETRNKSLPNGSMVLRQCSCCCLKQVCAIQPQRKELKPQVIALKMNPCVTFLAANAKRRARVADTRK